MERRGFLGALFGGAAAVAGVSAITARPAQAKPAAITPPPRTLTKVSKPTNGYWSYQVDTSKPDNPVIGQMWINMPYVKYWDGDEWVRMDGGE